MTPDQQLDWNQTWPQWADTSTVPPLLDLSFWATVRNRLRKHKVAAAAQHLGENVYVRGKLKVINQGTLTIGDHCQLISDYQPLRLAIGRGASLIIGTGTVLNSAILAAQQEIRIGDNCRLAPFVHFMDSDFHDTVDRLQNGKSAPITIGDNVRLGAHTLVLRGVTIGDGAEVLPGSVVTKSVPPGARFAGVPAKQI